MVAQNTSTGLQCPATSCLYNNPLACLSVFDTWAQIIDVKVSTGIGTVRQNKVTLFHSGIGDNASTQWVAGLVTRELSTVRAGGFIGECVPYVVEGMQVAKASSVQVGSTDAAKAYLEGTTLVGSEALSVDLQKTVLTAAQPKLIRRNTTTGSNAEFDILSMMPGVAGVEGWTANETGSALTDRRMFPFPFVLADESASNNGNGKNNLDLEINLNAFSAAAAIKVDVGLALAAEAKRVAIAESYLFDNVAVAVATDNVILVQFYRVEYIGHYDPTVIAPNACGQPSIAQLQMQIDQLRNARQ